jgi:hypothetical protein
LGPFLESTTYRLYYCRRCSVQVQICSQCDYGNIYCARECVRRAGARYQRTFRGAYRHAERQRRWRERVARKVTHQPCESPTIGSSVSESSVTANEPIHVHPEEPIRDRLCEPQGRCAFCGAALPVFARLYPWRWNG